MNGVFTVIIVAGLILTAFGLLQFQHFLAIFLIGGAAKIIANVK